MNKIRGPVTATAALMLAVVLVAGMITTQPTQAQTTFKLLHAFTGTDGSEPSAGLVQDASGNLGCGVVFKIDESGIETILYSFLGYPRDGAYLNGIIENAAGNLYGTTHGGGTVFK